MGGAAERFTHICGKAAGGRFTQAVFQGSCIKPWNAARFTGAMHRMNRRLPQKPHPPRRAHEPDRREGYHRPIPRVVSKCALREAFVTRHSPYSYYRFPASVLESLPVSEYRFGLLREGSSPKSHPPESAAVSEPFVPLPGFWPVLPPIGAVLVSIPCRLLSNIPCLSVRFFVLLLIS